MRALENPRNQPASFARPEGRDARRRLTAPSNREDNIPNEWTTGLTIGFGLAPAAERGTTQLNLTRKIYAVLTKGSYYFREAYDCLPLPVGQKILRFQK